MQSALIQDKEPEAIASNDAMTKGVEFQGEHEGAGESDIITFITSLGG